MSLELRVIGKSYLLYCQELGMPLAHRSMSFPFSFRPFEIPVPHSAPSLLFFLYSFFLFSVFLNIPMGRRQIFV